MEKKLLFEFDSAEKSEYRLRLLNFGENRLFAMVLIAGFLIPLALHSTSFPNQLLVGTIVNALLAIGALNFQFKKNIPIIIFPAIAALISSFVFGSFTVFLVFLIPFIWIGNTAYVLTIKFFKLKKINYSKAFLASAAIKASIIGLGAFLLFSFGLIPQALLIPMSLIQLTTALSGGAIAGIISFSKQS